MIYWIIGIILFLITLFLLCMTKIVIIVGFQNKFYLRIKLPFKTIDSTKMQSKPKKEKQKTDKPKEPYDSFTDEFRHYKQFYRKNYAKIKRLFWRIKKSIVIDKFYFQYYYGFEDAAFNAIAFGIVNGIVYNVYALISHHFKVNNTNIKIAPDFNNHLKIIEFESIIKIRIADIITNALRLIPLLLKLRKYNKSISSAK